MKLTETELKELAAQLQCPDGEAGIKVGEMMNFTNGTIISKAIGNLNLQDGDSVLEIGPGNGSHVPVLMALANDIHYDGIDISETMVADAQKRNAAQQNVFFHLSDGKKISFGESEFDKVFTVNTIYFWKNPQHYAGEIARVIKTGGILSVGFIPESTMQYIPFAKYGFELYDIETVTALLNYSGFGNITAVTEKEFVTSNSGEQIEREFVILTAKKL